MLIKLVLLLFFCALLLLASADLLLHFAFAHSADYLTVAALSVLFMAFALLAVAALITASHNLSRQLRHFFSASERLQRRLYFFANKQAYSNELFACQRQQINFFKQQRQRYLLEKNNRRQVCALSNTIRQRLIMLKPILPAPAFKQLRDQHQQYRQQLNSVGLIDLLRTIDSLTTQ
ncbi:MAG: hypothetical protein D4R63_12860 [Methylococcaceae bacterium]|nr:MAG: hypothetical protein D4R63_12860 [Methylococcaceae bacterium]